MADCAKNKHRKKDTNPRICRRHGFNNLRICTVFQYQIIRAEVKVRKKEPSSKFTQGEKGQPKGTEPDQSFSGPCPGRKYQGNKGYRGSQNPRPYGAEAGSDD